MACVEITMLHTNQVGPELFSLHDRVVKKGVSFLRGNVSIITSSDRVPVCRGADSYNWPPLLAVLWRWRVEQKTPVRPAPGGGQVLAVAGGPGGGETEGHLGWYGSSQQHRSPCYTLKIKCVTIFLCVLVQLEHRNCFQFAQKTLWHIATP